MSDVQIFKDSAADRSFRPKWFTGRLFVYALLLLWARTRIPAVVGAGPYWRASSVAPLAAFAHRGGLAAVPECVP